MDDRGVTNSDQFPNGCWVVRIYVNYSVVLNVRAWPDDDAIDVATELRRRTTRLILLPELHRPAPLRLEQPKRSNELVGPFCNLGTMPSCPVGNESGSTCI